MNKPLLALFVALASAGSVHPQPTIHDVPDASARRWHQRLPVLVNGRVEQAGPPASTIYRRQWPGTYFETVFTGTQAAFRTGDGDMNLHVIVDGELIGKLVRPQAGLHTVTGLRQGLHRLRVEVVSESQDRPTDFGGFVAYSDARPGRLKRRSRQIELIGDSHTVGYGNTSPKQECTEREVWETTDTSQGIGGIIGRAYNADYRVNAISGRGVVRNFAGMAGDTLPQAYPFVLFGKATRASDSGWQPQVIIVSLGTNDFSTPLHKGEKWVAREDLHRDFEKTYVRFIQDLRRRQPQARFVLWATDLADGEIASEVRKVVNALRENGEDRVSFVLASGLALTGCHSHPSVADDGAIADRIRGVIDGHRDSWSPRRRQ